MALKTPQSTHTEPKERDRIPALDGIRGVAILLVMLIHFPDRTTTQGSLANQIFLQIADTGWVGVDLFFVLSGFLITGLLLDSKTSPSYFRDFYARRTLRIFPLYYACLLVWFVLLPVFHPPHSRGSQEALARLQHEQAWYWAYLSNWRMGFDGEWAPLGTSVYWSLAIEEQFYLVWAGVVLMCSPRRLCYVCAALIVGALAARIALVVAGAHPILIYVSTPTRIDALAMGALVAAVVSCGTDQWVRAQRWAPWMLPAAVLSLGVIWVWIGRFSLYHPLMQTAGFTALAALFGSLLVLVSSLPESHWLAGALSSRVLRFFGKYSYAMYLFHETISTLVVSSERLRPFVSNDFWMQGAKLTVALMVTVASAWVSWHVLEKHFLALKRYFPATHSAKGFRSGDVPGAVET